MKTVLCSSEYINYYIRYIQVNELYPSPLHFITVDLFFRSLLGCIIPFYFRHWNISVLLCNSVKLGNYILANKIGELILTLLSFNSDWFLYCILSWLCSHNTENETQPVHVPLKSSQRFIHRYTSQSQKWFIYVVGPLYCFSRMEDCAEGDRYQSTQNEILSNTFFCLSLLRNVISWKSW